MPPERPNAHDRVQRLADDALTRLVAELEAGRSEGLREFLRTVSKFHRYSWTNTLLIQSQRPDATRVAGYHTWQDLGRSVRRGEKGVVIYAPLTARTRSVAPEGSKGPEERSKADDTRLVGFRAVYVFDVSQTEGKPLPTLSRTGGDPKEHLSALKAVVAARGITLSYDAAIAPADGVSSGGHIRLRPGLEAAEEFSVLTHELAHEMLHHGTSDDRLPKVVRETQAEAVAYVVCHGIGLETRSAAADYISLYDGDAKTLTESLATIQATSSKILNELLPQERERPEATRETRRGGDARGQDTRPQTERSGPEASDSLSMDR